jgi:hypothetical protein
MQTDAGLSTGKSQAFRPADDKVVRTRRPAGLAPLPVVRPAPLGSPRAVLVITARWFHYGTAQQEGNHPSLKALLARV